MTCPRGDLEAVLNYALRAAKQKLEQRKFAATERPRAGHRRSNPDGRHIPAEVRRAVWQRDGGQCTFTSDRGHRCEERKDLQFDHVEPYARGGEASIGGIRLLCRAHNQHEAERTLGAEFMRHRRAAARIRASEEEARGPRSAASAASPTGGRE
jgi:5-methylcytosine-specific restriction endonuclease McrA